jgi:lipopolysaccharide export system protein LptA
MSFSSTKLGALAHHKILKLLCLLFFVSAGNGFAQQQKADTADKIRIIIADAKFIDHFQTDSGSFNKFITNVVVYQGTDTLYCDSLFQYVEKKKLEAFGNVRIAQQGGTEATCDYLRYTSDQKLAYMLGNVTLTDGQNRLWCEELTYDLGTKTGVYNQHGTLQSDSTIVSSTSGVYNVRTHEARFTGNVIISDPQYKISSKDLGYNTETKVETFYGYSVVTSDSGRSVLSTSRGTYDSKLVIARFAGHSSIWNDGEYIEADSMHYDKRTGYGFAIGNVITIDTAQHATIYCGRADFFRKKRVLWATINPVMELATGKDTFYMRADTFYSAPMIRVKGTAYRMPVDTEGFAKHGNGLVNSKHDSLTGNVKPEKIIAKPEADTIKTTKRGRHKKAKQTADTVAVANTDLVQIPDSTWAIPATKFRLSDFFKDTVKVPAPIVDKKGRKVKMQPMVTADTTDGDTTAPVFFTGYHHVLIFSDSLQARCDSVTYTRSDSIVRMITNPVAWSRGSQITGDTILMQLDSSSVRSMYVPDNAFVVSRSGPEKAQIFDQVQGKTLTAYMKNNNIRKMIVFPDAQSIYYTKDDAGAYIGVTEVSSVLMRVLFGEEKISKILYISNVKETMTPMEQADLPNTRLSRFKWLYDERPASKEELFK